MYVLDTTTVSALMRSEPAATARLLATQPGEVFIPQPVLGELRYGLARLARSRRRTTLEARLDLLLGSLERAVWDDTVSSTFGNVKAHLESRGARIDDFDLAIAAHALVLGAAVVTENLRHFTRIPKLRAESWR